MAIEPLGLRARVYLYIVQRLILFSLRYRRLINRNGRPAYTKAYACRPTLENRFFLPPGAMDRNSTSARKYPLVLDIHGGGFIAYHPAADDEYCTLISTRCSAIVVSMNYRKAPGVQFPVPVDDCVAIAKAVIEDTDLPIDHSRVVISGMSAGGTLALSTAQNESLRRTFKAMVIWYPISDFTIPMQTRIDYRPKAETEDPLVPAWHYIECAYISPLHDLENPNLSPYFSDIGNYPPQAFIIAAEEDILSYDSYMMVQKLAGNSKRIEYKADNNRISGWAADGKVWCLAHQQPHAFNMITAKTKGKEAKRVQATNEVNERLIRWLNDEVLREATA